MGEINRTYKSSVFYMVFKDKKRLLSLYNALNDTRYDNPDDLEITTLENAIYMNVKNDVSCLLAQEMHLYEHQSTVNPNMPLRDFIYVSRLYETLIHKRDYDIYSKKPLKIPAPKFITFYNGVEEQPEKVEMYLSDLYEKKLAPKEQALELKVVQYNINPGYNTRLKNACRELLDYTEYVSRVRKYKEECSLEEAVDRAVEECIKEGILSDFFENQKAEVKAMSIFEYDEEKHIRKEKEESWEAGKQEGRLEGLGALVDVLKVTKTDFRDLYETIKSYEIYKSVTEEQVRRYY